MSQKVSPHMDLPYCVIRPLDAAEGKWGGRSGKERKKIEWEERREKGRR